MADGNATSSDRSAVIGGSIGEFVCVDFFFYASDRFRVGQI